MHPSLVLELEEQAVAALRGELGREADRGASPCVGGVGVEVAEVARAERDEVAAGAEVGLGADRLAVARDAEREVALAARA